MDIIWQTSNTPESVTPHPHAYVESRQDAQWTYVVMACWMLRLSESEPEGLFVQRDSVPCEMWGLFGLERNPKVYTENSLGLGSLTSSCFQRAGGWLESHSWVLSLARTLCSDYVAPWCCPQATVWREGLSGALKSTDRGLLESLEQAACVL